MLNVTCLGHEPFDHTVKAHVVIGTFAHQLFHAGDMGGRHIGQQLNHHLTAFQRHEDRVFGVFDLGHAILLSGCLRLVTALPAPRQPGGLTARPCPAMRLRKHRPQGEPPMAWNSLDDMSLAGKRVLTRVDINVPMDGARVTDTTRIDRIVLTIRDILAAGGKPVLLAHFWPPQRRAGARDELAALSSSS